MQTKLVLCLLLLIQATGFCWNGLGHRLVAQIAYNHLTAHTKQIANLYNQTLNKGHYHQNFVNAAAWLDWLRDDELLVKHYINLPFSIDGTPLLPPNKSNAITAIKESILILKNQATVMNEKGFYLRVLLHVVADLHQPMHAVSQFSKFHPYGDKGGNLFRLKSNRIASNLHAYWDKGGGFLTAKQKYSKAQLIRKAYNIEKKWPCELQKMNLNPIKWANESHQLALTEAYQLKLGEKPNNAYEKKVKKITEQQIALAGCRLAALLNKVVD